MKRTGGQFPICENCGREIRENPLKISTRKQGEYQMFHKDAHGCSNAPEQKEHSQRAKKNS